MNNKIELPLDLAERLQRALNQVGVQDHLCDYALVSNAQQELKDALERNRLLDLSAAPVVDPNANLPHKVEILGDFLSRTDNRAPVVERPPVVEGVSVDRELLVIANVCVMRSHDLLVEQMKTTDHKDEYRAEIARLKDAHEKIKRTLLPTSSVEFQPAAYVLTRDDEVCYEPDDGIVISNTVGDETDRLKWEAVYFAPPELAELQATIAQQAAEIGRIKTISDNYSALLMDANAEIERLKGGSVACTSCDGSGEYIDAIGDWRGYCSCPAGIALKNKPVPTSVAPDGWRLVPLHPTMDMLDALMEWNKVGNVNAYNNILNAAPACLDKAKELNQ